MRRGAGRERGFFSNNCCLLVLWSIATSFEVWTSATRNGSRKSRRQWKTPPPKRSSGARGKWRSTRSSQGRVLRTEGDYVLVDVGYKSEGIILRSEWEEGEALPKPGQIIKVLIEDVEDIHGLVDDSRGMITLSKRKAEKIEAWLQGHGDGTRGGRGHRRGHAEDQGRPAGGHRRARVPAGQPGGHPPAGRHRRLHRADHPVRRAEDRRGAAEHRRQPPGADRGGAGREEGPAAGRARSRPAPQGHRQEHRRFRGLRRPGRHRRPAAHHRHELGPHQPPLGNAHHRPGNRGADPAHRLREGKDRPGAEAEVAQPLGERRAEVPRRQAASAARSST